MSLPAPVLFAAHLLAFLVALAAALALARERTRGITVRTAGALGFLALAGAAAYHGGGFASDTGPVIEVARTTGYGLLFLAALPRSRAAPVAALAPLPGGTVIPAVVAVLAGAAQWRRRRSEAAGAALGAGLLLLGSADALLALDATWIAAASHGIQVVGYLCVGRMVLALTRQSIRFRFMVGFAGLLLAVVLFVSAALGTVIERNIRDGALARVSGQAEEAQAALVREITGEVEALVFVGGADEIAEPIRRGQSLSTDLIKDLRARLFPDVDFILFLDHDGEVRGRFGVEPAEAVEMVGTRVVEFALRREREVSSLDTLARRGLALIGVAPIETTGRAEPAGFAVAGFLVDDDLLQRVVIAGRGSRAAAFLGLRGGPPVLVARAGFSPDQPVAPPDLLEETFRNMLAGEGPESRTVTLAGEEHFAALSPLRPELGSPVGILLVAEPAAAVAAARRDVNQVLFLVTVGVIGLAFVLALLAARRITGPLEGLTGAARRVQAGDLHAKAPVRGEDEVAELAGAFNQMTDSVTDMTAELRQAAAEQSRLRARLETVVDSMGEGLIAVDDRERVVAYNPAAGTIVGRTREQVVGRPLGQVLEGRAADGRELAGEPPPGGLVFVRRRDGNEIPVAITSSPLRDDAGVQLGSVYVLRDVTRERELEQMKTEFLANVSHELRTPLTPIIGYSELLAKREIPSDKAREFAGGILDSARRLERIVAMLVDFSAIEAGRLTVHPEPTRLGPVIESALTRWRERAKDHRFAARIDPDAPPGQVSTELFGRILEELLDNAVKYSPDGGPVTVSLSSQNGGRMLKVDVADRGIGIEPGDLARIFQDFRQVDASGTRTFGGLGLGLTFAKRLIEAHGGTVTAASDPGRGTTFSFTIPSANGR